MKQFFCLIFLIFLFNRAYSQENCQLKIEGVVQSNEKSEKIPGAIVYIKGTNNFAISDENGKYTLPNLCPGHYTLVCEITSFEKFELEVHLEKNETDNIQLKEDIIELNEIVVQAQRSENTPQLSQKVAPLIIRERSGENLGNILKGMTGVESLQTGSTISKPVIHGMHSTRVLLINQGIRQEGQQWGSEHAPEIDPFISSNIEIIKGPAGLRYGGDAIGGVILMQPNPLPDSAKISGKFQSVYFSNGRQWVGSGYLEGSIKEVKGFSWRIQGTLKNGGNTSTANYFLANTGIKENNYSGTIGYKKKDWKQELFYSSFQTEIGIYAGSHIGNINDLRKAILLKKPPMVYTPANFIRTIEFPKQLVIHHLLKYKNSYSLPNKASVKLTLSHQINDRKEYDIPRTQRNTNVYTFDLKTNALELVYDELNQSKDWRGLWGFNLQNQANITSGNEVRKPKITSSLLPNYYSNSAGIFAIEKLTKEEYELEIGARYDLKEYEVHQNETAYSSNYSEEERFFHGFSGSIGGKYHWSHQFEQSLTLARAFRPASINELYSFGVHHGAGAFEIGRNDLRGEKSMNFSLNNSFSVGPLHGEIGFYTNILHDFIYLKPLINKGMPVYTITVRGSFPTFGYSQINAQFSGIDANLHLKIAEHFHLGQKYSIIAAKDLNSQDYLVNIPTNRASWDLTYIFDKDRQKISLGWTQVAQQKRYTKGTDFLPPPPAYGLMELNWDINKENFGLGIRISNLLNTEYRDYLNRFRYFTADMGRNISLRMNYQF